MKIKSKFLSLAIVVSMICASLVIPAMAANNDYWKTFANIYFEEDFEGETYSCTAFGKNTRYFNNSAGNTFWRYVSNNSTLSVVNDPAGGDNDVLKITPTNTISGPAFWCDQNTLMSGWENLTDKFIYEQKYYLSTDALKNGGYLMWQIFDNAGSNSKIAFVAWDTGFNATVANNTVDTAYALPRNEWFTIRGEFDFTAKTIYFYVIKADGTKTHVFTNTMNNAIKNSGLGRLRATYSENPATGKNQSVYYDDIYYYTLDTSLATVPEGYLGMTGSGTATEVGSQLSITPKFINNTAPYDYTIQWYRVDVGMYTYADAKPQAIEGATGETYTVTSDDDGCYIFAKFIVKGSSIAEGMADVELDTYPQQPIKEWAFNVGKGVFKDYTNIFFSETFDNKTYAYTSNTGNSGTKGFADNNGNVIWRYNSVAMPAVVTDDPGERTGKSLKLTAEYTGENKEKYCWVDNYNLFKNDDLQKIHIYEHEIFLDDMALKNGGVLLFQYMNAASSNQILYAIRSNGFNISSSSTDAVTNYTLPRNEWFKIITVLNYSEPTYTVKLQKANGDIENILADIPLANAFKTNGTVRMRATYRETVTDKFAGASVYFDNVNYYSTDEDVNYEVLGDKTNPYLIATEADLISFRYAVHKNAASLAEKTGETTAVSALCAKLTDDITLTSDWEPIGYSTEDNSYLYGGIFDGAGHTISNMTAGKNGVSGLIGESGAGLVIKNLTVKGEAVATALMPSGGFVAKANAVIEFNNCTNKVNITGAEMVGGFIGNPGEFAHSFTNCANYGNITNTSSASVGGFVGNEGCVAQTFTNCANYGVIKGAGEEVAAGIAAKGKFVNCIGYGSVINTSGSATALYDKQSGCTATNCYYRADAASGTGEARNGGIAKTTQQFANGDVAYSVNVGAHEVICGQSLGNDMYPVFADKNMVYYINDNTYSNQNGVFVSAQADSVLLSSMDGAVGYVAQYDSEGALVDVSMLGVSETVKEYTIIPDADAANVKVFVWDKNYAPLHKCAEFDFDENVLVDYLIDVEEGREPVILQITDTQIIDSAQMRSSDRLDAIAKFYWDTDKIDERCFNYIRDTVEATNPDLILLTGDLVYGEFDDNGSAFSNLVKYMDTLGIPWAPIMGNHEIETNMGADWQCDVLENATNCLFKQRTLTGNGNYTVGITQGGVLKRVFFMLDSNGTKNLSEASRQNGHSIGTYGFGDDQIKWYTNIIDRIKKYSPDTKLSFAYHAPMAAFVDAYAAKYGFSSTNIPVDIDSNENRQDGDFGYIGTNLSTWDNDKTVYNGLKAFGVDSMFTGHFHCINASVVYDGIRFQCGNKTGAYDQINYRKDDGTIIASYRDAGFPLVGGTVLTLSEEDGSINNAYNYFCDTEY